MAPLCHCPHPLSAGSVPHHFSTSCVLGRFATQDMRRTVAVTVITATEKKQLLGGRVTTVTINLQRSERRWLPSPSRPEAARQGCTREEWLKQKTWTCPSHAWTVPKLPLLTRSCFYGWVSSFGLHFYWPRCLMQGGSRGGLGLILPLCLPPRGLTGARPRELGAWGGKGINWGRLDQLLALALFISS